MARQIENAYRACPYVSSDTTLDGSFAGKLARANTAITLTLNPEGWLPDQWVDIANIGIKPVTIAGDGLELALHPDQLNRVVFLGPDGWNADRQSAMSRQSHQILAASDDGLEPEARTDNLSIGMDLVLEGDGSAGYWRAPWPGILTAVAAASRGGSASIQMLKTRSGVSTPIAGFSAPMRLPAPLAVPFDLEEITISDETFAAGDSFSVSVTDHASLVPDPDGIVGIGVSLHVTRTAP